MRSQRVKSFIDEIISVCKKHGLSISHEDDHGSFIITKFNASYAKWLENASEEEEEKEVFDPDSFKSWLNKREESQGER